ncbi:GNAT family N-acetyltransferase [Streptomyces sp. NPDC007172]|uniref:GNAT family N-acetyltransferase n=1 Tax=Streptomyces sp. NPDC007172 TaxID=3364776 RepID=UPI0036B92C65
MSVVPAATRRRALGLCWSSTTTAYLSGWRAPTTKGTARGRGGQVLGYACSQIHRDQEAFRETVEVSIGLVKGSRGQGLGTSLYRALFGLLADEPIHAVLAGIALPNDASVALHRRFGFSDVGIFREYAVKNGQYISSLWMQRLQSDPLRVR